LIGVNNQYRGRDLEEYRKQLKDLLHFAIEKSGGNPKRVVALSIPDWGITPFAKEKGRDAKQVAADIDSFNQAKREECERLGIHYVDITDISREAIDANKSLLAEDGLHPSGEMYRRWVERVVPIIKKELEIK
jgi:lysophospholipase L1-like esterase